MDANAVDNSGLTGTGEIHGEPSRLIHALAEIAKGIKRYVIAAISMENCPL